MNRPLFVFASGAFVREEVKRHKITRLWNFISTFDAASPTTRVVGLAGDSAGQHLVSHPRLGLSDDVHIVEITRRNARTCTHRKIDG